MADCKGSGARVIPQGTPCVSVIMAVYNRERFVGEALDSIFQQDYRPLEVIVVDDGSTDGSVEAVRARPDARLILQAHQGASAARNLGLRECHGDLVAFLDSDDLWAPHKLRTQVDYLVQNPNIAYCVAATQNFLQPGCPVPTWVQPDELARPQFPMLLGPLLARREVFERVGDFDTSYERGEDTEWFLRAHHAGIPPQKLREVLLFRRVHDSNLTQGSSFSTLARIIKESLDRKRAKQAVPSANANGGTVESRPPSPNNRPGRTQSAARVEVPGPVYLTFDDGPSPEVTPWVLDTLDAFEAKATFFCLGRRILARPDLFAEIQRRGHSVGSHSFSHLDGHVSPLDDYLADVDACARLVPSKLFRPPFGQLTPDQLRRLRSQYRIVWWTFDSHDYDRNVAPEDCLAKAIAGLSVRHIGLFHDAKGAATNLRHTLPRLLDHLRRGGASLEALDMTMPPGVLPDVLDGLRGDAWPRACPGAVEEME